MRGSEAHQRGWASLIVILLALAIVAVLARDALKQYGFVSNPEAGAKSKPATGERTRLPGALGAQALDPGSAAVTPAAALERARGVEEMVKQQAEERAKRVDSEAK